MREIHAVRLYTYIVCLVLLVLTALWIKPQYAAFPPLETWSMILGYLAYVCIAITLLIGPIRPWLPKRWTAHSQYLRRDLGILAGLAAIAHVLLVFILFSGEHRLMLINSGANPPNSILSLFIHVYPGEETALYPNWSLVGIANYLGLAALLIVLCLWLTSSDKATSWLGAPAWKRLHMGNPFLFVLVVFHALIYVHSIKGNPHSFADFLWLAAIVAAVRSISFARTIRARHKR
ncbi:ferric reductase-like transmembrane domain-containing protein [Brevibacillus sp. TJ4]|uniref:ferric reductase-like transmembrane domain-containing protein n=1 Tax=Brevibacillus sp. TJ4 TaxID=3234853 RepID=UPI0037D1C3CE